MTKRVQILGHEAEVANQFIGLDRELTIDTDNREIRIHDAVTPGGKRVLDRDANDNRYQAKSEELDGLLGWEPNQRGLVVRLGPADYRLRELVVDTGNLALENGDGYDGNPTLSLAPEITTAHTVNATWTFSEVQVFEFGIQGDVEGDVTGNLEGDSWGTHTGPVVGDAAGNHTGSFTGDVDTRGATVEMDDGQILLNWLNTDIIDFIWRAGCKPYSVIMFAGPESEIPEGWAICNGLNGTPNLVDRFVCGAVDDSNLGATGGASTHGHSVTVAGGGAHGHDGTTGGHALTVAEMPSHSHFLVTSAQSNVNMVPGNAIAEEGIGSYRLKGVATLPVDKGTSSSTGSGAEHTHDFLGLGGGDHSHTGSASAGSSLPPYCILYFIMKLPDSGPE